MRCGCGDARGGGEGWDRRRRDRRDRHHQPARDGSGVGPRDRRANSPRDRMAGPAYLRAVRAAQGRRRRGDGSGQNRAAARSLFFRDQTRLDPRRRAWRARRCRAGEPGVRHNRLFPAVAADARQSARDRPDQCVAHLAVRHHQAGLGRRAAAAVPHPRAAAAGGVRQRPHLRGGGPFDPRPRDPDRRHGRRPAGRPVRPGVLHAGHDQVDLWHRLLCVDERRRPRRSARTAGC